MMAGFKSETPAGFVGIRSEDAYRGRKPSYTRTQLEAVRDLLAQGTSISSISKTTGLSRQAVYRIQSTPAEAEAALARWTA